MHFVQMVLNFNKMSRKINHDLQDADGGLNKMHKPLQIFLASPSDLDEERQAAKRIVEEENKNHANHQRVDFKLVGWEDTVPQPGRPQQTINLTLDQCDYFVGMLWRKWGSDPGPNGGPYSSGFEEEYCRSFKRFEDTGKPGISLFFKSINSDEEEDPGKQLSKVLKFKDDIKEKYTHHYGTFSDLAEFKYKFRATVAKILNEKILNDKMKDDSNFEAKALSKTLETESISQGQKVDTKIRLST